MGNKPASLLQFSKLNRKAQQDHLSDSSYGYSVYLVGWLLVKRGQHAAGHWPEGRLSQANSVWSLLFYPIRAGSSVNNFVNRNF